MSLLNKKLLKKKERMMNCIPYPFRFIFKHRKEILNSKNVFFKLVGYYLKRIFKLNLDYESSSVLLLYSQTRIELPIDSLCEMDDIYEREIYDKQWKINKNSVVIDIGAHVGIFTLKMAKRAGIVVAVEPNTDNFNLLIANVIFNKFENVVPLHLAISDHIGEEILYFNKSSLGHSFFKKESSCEKVQTDTLDNLVKTFEADFIKINAEGAETKILDGGKKFLKSSNVTLAVSTHSPLLKERVKEFLRFHNFSVKEGELNIIHANKEIQT